MKNTSENKSANMIPEGCFCSMRNCRNCYYAGEYRGGDVECLNRNYGGWHDPNDREGCLHWK